MLQERSLLASLELLRLDKNRISNAGMQVLAEALANQDVMASLGTVIVSGNSGASEAQAGAQALRAACSTRSIKCVIGEV